MKGNMLPLLTWKKNMPIGQTLLLAMMSLLTSGLEDQSLFCYHDYVENFTCEWNSLALESGLRITAASNCFLRGICNDFYNYNPVQKDLVSMKSSHPELLKASLKFKDKCLQDGDLNISVDVLCGGITVAKISKFDLLDNVKMNPPGKPQVDGANVSWTLGSPHSKRIPQWKFQIQFKPQDQSWEEVMPVEVSGSSCLLSEDQLTFGKQYEVRVRSCFYDENLWSDWSLSTLWISTVGSDPVLNQDIRPWWFPSVTGTVVVVTVAVILLIVFRCHPVKCSLKSSDISNPFEDLYSIHGGDFKSWLGSFVAPETFVKADIENISPLELCKPHDCGVKGKIKSFSNSMYFVSQSSKFAAMDLEPCPEQSPYGPAGGSSVEEKVLLADVSHNSDIEHEESISGPLETSSSYKHLQKLRLDVQSPDSGFAAGSDQESQESSSEGLPSPPVVGNILPINNVLACPIPRVPHVVGFPHLLFLPSPGFGWSPQTQHPLELLQSRISKNPLMDNPDIMGFTGMVEPASEDYMPVKKVQE